MAGYFTVLNHIFSASVLLLVLAAEVKAKNSYIFIAPNTVRPARVYSIQGELLEDPSSAVTITAELTGGDGLIASTSTTVNGKQAVNLDLDIPSGLKKSSISLKIKGTGGLTFSSTKSVKFEEKSSSVFIQTDKSVYKPGQTVNFRVFGVTPDLRVIFDKVEVGLFDPKGNKINQWFVAAADMRKEGGVYVQHQVMSDEPELGTWKLKAKLLSHSTDFTEQAFNVDEYVLPKFDVEFDLPAFGLTTDKTFEGKVKAKYTFGKPVKGEVSLRIKPKRERFQWKNNKRTSISKTIELKFPINGKASFTLQMSRLKEIERSLSGSSLVFEANVTEALTKSRQSETKDIKFYSKRTKLELPKSLPSTFKPGMKYNAVVKVSQQDGSPPNIVDGQLKITVTEYRRGKQIDIIDRPRPMPSRRRPWFWDPIPFPRPPKDTTKVKTTYHSIPADGIVQTLLDINSAAYKVKIVAYYDGVSTTKSIKKSYSPSDTFIQITLANPTSLQAGKSTTFDVKSTQNPETVRYQVFSRGVIVDSGDVTPSTGKLIKWSLLITAKMAPRVKIVVYFVRADGEVVADTLTLNVEGIFENKVSVGFKNTKAQPSEKVDLDVTADAGSRVNILGVDKSVLLMGTENDISKSQVLKELQQYDTKSTKKSRDNHIDVCWFCWRWPQPSSGEDVKDVFEDAGVIVLTDALIYEHREPQRPRPRPRPLWGGRNRMMRRNKFRAVNFAGGGGPMMAMAAPIRPMMASSRMAAPRMEMALALDNVPVPKPEELAPVQKTRKLFPETWIWENTVIPKSGSWTKSLTVPDTITSWVVSAFAVHPQSGLGLTESSAQLQVSVPFFMSVNLPYSIIRGEKVILQVNIHNYSPKALVTYVTLSQNPEFDNINIVQGMETRTSQDVTRTVNVGKDEILSVYFPIVPTKIGTIDLMLTARSLTMSDSVKKQLPVEAEGSPREYNIPIVFDFKKQGTKTETTTVEFPARTVSGSQRVTATVIGDLMGPSITGLDKLLKMPYGCGEQNMLKFSPNIFITKYLEVTKNFDDAVLTKAKEFMEKGYQRELTYSHTDGSFSAFGKRDDSGSMWLTAFVVKSFVQAKPYIFVDDKVINKAIDWIRKNQDTDGTFKEPGRVIHKEMQGGSTSGKVSLTAYVLIALLEARVVEGVAAKIEGVQSKAQKYLEDQIPGLTNVYDLAIVGYSLELAGSPKSADIWEKLLPKAKSDAGAMWWEKVTKPNTAVKQWEKRNGKAVNIELTSYILLTLANKKDRINGVQVLKWITEQRNPDGGFSSTQDTVLALQALSEMASLIYSSVHDITVTISGKGYTDTLRIDNTNALVLQSRELPSDIGKVSITATGKGLALVQIGVFYKIDSDDQKQSFMLKVTQPYEGPNDFEVNVCASWLDKGSSSMAVIEIGILSGFMPDLSSIMSKPDHAKAEMKHRNVVLYFDEIGSKDTCTTISMHRTGMVTGAQPVPVKVYDYYEPTKQVTEFYVPEAIQSSNVCEVCTDCDFCTRKA